jgi:hypothetical protein
MIVRGHRQTRIAPGHHEDPLVIRRDSVEAADLARLRQTSHVGPVGVHHEQRLDIAAGPCRADEHDLPGDRRIRLLHRDGSPCARARCRGQREEECSDSREPDHDPFHLSSLPS